jgi:hypothetical protein
MSVRKGARFCSQHTAVMSVYTPSAGSIFVLLLKCTNARVLGVTPPARKLSHLPLHFQHVVRGPDFY